MEAVRACHLRNAAGETKTLTGYYGRRYVTYDRTTGDILTHYHCDINNWVATMTQTPSPYAMPEIP